MIIVDIIGSDNDFWGSEVIVTDELGNSIKRTYEIKRDINEIKRRKRKVIRVPEGYNLVHRRGYEARKGFGYEFSDLNIIKNHKLQHKIDNNGRRII